MKAYKEAIGFFEEYEELCDFVGEFSEEVVASAEKKLGVNFPESYKAFLMDYGAGNFGSEEVYGIVTKDFTSTGIPDAIWLNLNEREENDLPEELIIVYYDGDEWYYCLDTEAMDGTECPVVSVGIGELDGEREKVHDTFGELLLELASNEIE